MDPAAPGRVVIGWRAFSVDGDGRLVAPFAERYWRDLAADHAWTSVEVTATCLVEDHAAPADGCTCGLRSTASLSELLTALKRPFAGSSRSILDEAGVLAEVELSGRVMPGVDVPNDDPLTTSRGERARVLSLHLSPARAKWRVALEDRYAVPVSVYTRADWPRKVGRPDRPSARDAFLADVRRTGFGTVQVTGNEALLEQLAHDAIATMAEGVPAGDIATALFESAARPTVAQAKAFVEAAIAAFAPQLEFVDRGAQFSQGVTAKQAWRRATDLDQVGAAFVPIIWRRS